MVALLALGVWGSTLQATQLVEGQFAIVNGEVISQQTFDTFMHVGKQQRFFHGDIPAAQEAAFRKEVAQRLVDQVLLREAARARNVEPDPEWVASRLASIEARYRSRPNWEKERDGIIAELRPQLEEQSRFERLEAQVREVDEPSEAELRGFYQANTEKFTTPERVRVSLILLGVEPWAPSAQWQAALDEAERLLKKLHKGGDFSEMARLHSSDESAQNGGDMGFVHRGMLAEEAQKAIDALQPGEVSAALRLLKGVAIFRVEERVAPQLNPFERVVARAQELYVREKKDKNWRDFVEQMRGNAKIEMREALQLNTDN